VSWLIEGTMKNGRILRPSDWVERVSGVMAKFGADHRLRYGAVRPCFVKGKKCLLVQKSLQLDDPTAFEYVRNFVCTNGLQMKDVGATLLGNEPGNEPAPRDAIPGLGAVA
jgi:Protein of unknown function (DUF3579)